MPNSESFSGDEVTGLEVLTLPEIAAFLRVPEEAVVELISKDGLPARKIGGEWRFLKRAVIEWMRWGLPLSRELRGFPAPWVLDHPFWDELVRTIESRIFSKIPTTDRPTAKPGSKEAVLKHFGVFKDDDDMEEQLANLRAQRVAVPARAK